MGRKLFANPADALKGRVSVTKNAICRGNTKGKNVTNLLVGGGFGPVHLPKIFNWNLMD